MVPTKHEAAKNQSNPTIFVVDDDAKVRQSLGDFLRASGFEVAEFASASGFLDNCRPGQSGCLILDLHMPEISGIELQEALQARGIRLPAIIVSGQASIADAVKATRLGAFEFIEKPYSPDVLLKRVHEALELDREKREESAKQEILRGRLRSLTKRERQILSWVVVGHDSKTIAEKAGLSVSTVNNHRSNIMEKLAAKTAADLSRIAILADPSLALPVSRK